MQYVICVNLPGCLPEMDPYKVEDLQQAREAAANELERSSSGEPRGHWLEDIENLPASGGIIGPLEDGYVIDVRPETSDV